MKYDCVNLHFTDYCNFNCKHCFVKKENRELSFDELMIVVDKIEKYFVSNNIEGRINIAGGEPLLSRNIDELINYISNKGIKVSIITNGYLLDENFIEKHKDHLYSIGISIDSLNYDTNIKIGRCMKDNTISLEKINKISKMIKVNGIKLKINTCVSKLNCKENFNSFINSIKPDRFKVFQMVEFENVNDGVKTANDIEMESFLKKIDYPYIYESSKEMKESYLIIDSKGNVSTNNLHISNLSVFDFDLDEITNKIDIDYKNYLKRYS